MCSLFIAFSVCSEGGSCMRYERAGIEPFILFNMQMFLFFHLTVLSTDYLQLMITCGRFNVFLTSH